MWQQFWLGLCDARVRYAFSWIVLLLAVCGRGYTAWTNFTNKDRVDGNDGHTSIDFAGQWMMGRMIVTGHARELYSRDRHYEVAERAFPQANENPKQETHDAEHLVACYPGKWADPVGGPLYPPIHAFVMTPLALIEDPRIAYRVWQGVMFGVLALTALGIRYLTDRRWWWTVAMALLLLAPGSRGATDLGQNPPLTLALLIWGWALLVHGRASWCGVLWGLLAFKPVWAISFVGALLLLREWRALLAMVATGLSAVALTLPVVGLQVWFDWLHVGKLATAAYCIDHNWIFLSRDLFGIPRRIWLEFHDGRAIADPPFVGWIGWGMWLAIASATAWTVRRRWSTTRVGAFPAFVFCAAWLCTYRFMYYDALLAILAAVTLLAWPRLFWRKGRWWPFVFVAFMFIVENITGPMHIDVTSSVMWLRGTVLVDDQTVTTAPTIYLSSTDDYPWDTVVVFMLWLRCGWMVWWARTSTELGDGTGLEVVDD